MNINDLLNESNRSTKYDDDSEYDPEKAKKNDATIKSIIRVVRKNIRMFNGAKIDGINAVLNLKGRQVYKELGIDLDQLWKDASVNSDVAWIDKSGRSTTDLYRLGYE